MALRDSLDIVGQMQGLVESLLMLARLGAPLQTIFDPFLRLEPARSGGGEHCGLGLALVRAVCGVLGFKVFAQNQVDGSVAFKMMLDASASASQSLEYRSNTR